MLRLLLAACILLVGHTLASTLPAATPELLGIIALTAEPEVAEELELTPSQKERLRRLVILREDAGLSLALDVKDLPPDERNQRLAPFRAESERLGMQILTFRQRSLIQRIRLQRMGVAALIEPGMSDALHFSDQQRQDLEALAVERAKALHSAPGSELGRVEADYREAMLLVLATDQQEAFTEILGGSRPVPAADNRAEGAARTEISQGVAEPDQDPARSEKDSAETPAEQVAANEETSAPPRADGPTATNEDTTNENATEPRETRGNGRLRPSTANADADATRASDSGDGRERPATGDDRPANRRNSQDSTNPPTPPSPAIPTDYDPPGDGLLRFSFQYAPWKDVIEWFAGQNDLALQMDLSPPGTFNYSDPRAYTPGEALDLINRILLGKGFTLIRSDKMLFVVRIDDGIPQNLVPNVTPAELDDLGESELVSVVFPLSTITTEEARTEIEPLMRPQGSITELPRSKRIQVTETAGRLRLIRDVIDAIESPAASFGELQQIKLVHRLADEVLPLVRELLGIPDDANALPDNSLRVTVGLGGQQLLVRGTAERIMRLKEIVNLIDEPGPAGAGLATIQTPQLEVYPIEGADPAAVLRVLQTILAGDPDARLEVDEQTGNLYALARPAQHATIRATIAQAEQDARQIDVIPLTTVDPQVAVLAIGKLFGTGGETVDPSAPKVDADPTTRSLLVRGTDSQIAQIRTLLEKLGENMSSRVTGASRGNVRLLPLGGREATSALYQIQQIWPALRPNRIRVLSPSSGGGIPTFRPSDQNRPAAQEAPWEAVPLDRFRAQGGESAERAPSADDSSADGNQANATPRVPGVEAERSPLEANIVPQPRRNGRVADGRSGRAISHPSGGTLDGSTPATRRRTASIRFAAQRTGPGESPPILIAPGPGGVLIASEDTAALDELENLLATVASRAAGTGRELGVFYLRYARATTVAETLGELFGSGSSSGGGGGLIGDLAGAALGEAGGLVTGLLGMSGGGTTLIGGTVEIVPDTRLNALVVEAKPADLDTIEQLLRVLDQPSSPEDVEVDAPPRLIPVYNTSASEIAMVVQQVYQDRMRAGGGQQQQPSPEDIIRLLRGGRGGQGGGSREQEEAAKMSIGIDARSNSLVVRAPDPLFEEVKLLVDALDTAQVAFPQETRVVNLQGASSATVQRALSAIYGGGVRPAASPEAQQPGQPQTQAGRQRGAGRGGRGQNGGEGNPNPAEFFERIRRFQEFQQRMMQGGGEGRGGRGGR